MKKQAKTSKIRRPSAPGGVKLATDILNKIDGLISDVPINGGDKREALKRRFEMLLETSDQDEFAMIKAAQILRQINPREAAFAERIIITTVGSIVFDGLDDDKEIQRIRAKIRKLEKEKYQLEDDEYYTIDEMPDDLRKLNDQWNRRHREMEADIFRQFGEHDLANLYLNDEAYKAYRAGWMEELNERLQEKNLDDPTDFQKMPPKTYIDIIAEIKKDQQVTDSHGATEQA